MFDVIHKLNTKFEGKLRHSFSYDVLKSMEPYVPLLRYFNLSRSSSIYDFISLLFSNTPPKELVSLSKKVKFEIFEGGKYIYKHGDIGRNFYIVTYGCVEVSSFLL